MNLETFKLAAKRLRKQIAELTSSGAPVTLSQSHALDTLARVLGYRDYHEARVRLEDTVASKAPSVPQEPYILGLAGPAGCGKTLYAKNLVTAAIAQGIPVRILGFCGEYHQFASTLNAKTFRGVGEAGFLEAWRSDAPFVSVDLDAFEGAKGLNFAKMTVPANTLFVCDEVSLLRGNFKPLGGICVLVGQTSKHFPVEPAATFTWQQGEWTLRVPDAKLNSVLTDRLLRGLLA